jgi:sRNA-binding carbon storage regulator CsrA
MSQEATQEDLGSALRVQRKSEGRGRLVLTRERGQRIDIGNGIVVEVAEILGSRVKLLVTAPPEMSIKRSLKKGEHASSQNGATES